MAIIAYKNWAVDATGSIVPTAAIEVRHAEDNSLAVLASDAGGTPLANPFSAAATGDFEFFAEPDSYTVLVGSGPSQVSIPIQLVDSREAIVFDDVAEMVAAGGLFIGYIVTTRGYAAPGDQGWNQYEIVAAATGTDDGGTYIDLPGSGLQAKGLFPSGVHAAQYGDMTVDVGAPTNAALAAHGRVDLPRGGPFPLTTGIVVPAGKTLEGPGIEACELEITGATVIGVKSAGNRSSIGGFKITTAVGLAHTVNICQNGDLSTPAERVAWHDIYWDGSRKKAIGAGHNFEVVFGNTGEMRNTVSVDAADRCVSFSEATTDVNGWSFNGYNDWRGATNEPVYFGHSDANDSRSHAGGPIQCQASGAPVVINSRNNHLTIYSENNDQSASATVSVVSNGGVDYNCIDPHTSNTVVSKVVGTDGNDYDCIRNHVASTDNQPITGGDWQDYWVLNGSGSGATWAATTSYTTSDEPGVGAGWENKWVKAGTTGGAAWTDTTAYTAGRRQIVLGASATGNFITATNGNRIVDLSKSRKNVIWDKDIGSGSAGLRAPLRVDGVSGSVELTNAAGGILGNLKYHHSAAKVYEFLADGTDADQTLQLRNNQATRKLDFDVDGHVVATDGFYIGSVAAANLIELPENGTFTPTLTTDGTDFDSVTYDAGVAGRFTRIGKMIHFQLWMRTDAITKGAATGNVLIGGLPYAAVSGDNAAVASFSVGPTAAWAVNHPTKARGVPGASTLALVYGNGSFLQVSDVDTGTNDNEIYLTGQYLMA